MAIDRAEPWRAEPRRAEPRTEALRRALRDCAASSTADLMFLEAWEAAPVAGAAAALRVAQIRRANPTLAAEIRAELAHAARLPRRPAGEGIGRRP